MSLTGRVSFAVALGATGLLLSPAAHGQAPRFPKRCTEQPAPAHPLKVYVDHITLSDNSVPPGLSEDDLVALLKQRALAAGPKWHPELSETLRQAWQDRGYFEAVAEMEPHVVSSSPGALHVSLAISVDPGPQYRVDELHLFTISPGQKFVFSEQRLRDLIPLWPGVILDLGKVQDGMEALRDLYASHGYIDFQVTPGFEILNATDRITISFFLDQGRQYHVGTVQILGLDPFIRPLLQSQVAPGKVFDWSRVLDFYQTQQRGLVPGVSPADDEIHKDAKTGKVDLILDFRACPQHAPQAQPSGAKH